MKQMFTLEAAAAAVSLLAGCNGEKPAEQKAAPAAEAAAVITFIRMLTKRHKRR